MWYVAEVAMAQPLQNFLASSQYGANEARQVCLEGGIIFSLIELTKDASPVWFKNNGQGLGLSRFRMTSGSPVYTCAALGVLLAIEGADGAAAIGGGVNIPPTLQLKVTPLDEESRCSIKVRDYGAIPGYIGFWRHRPEVYNADIFSHTTSGWIMYSTGFSWRSLNDPTRAGLAEYADPTSSSFGAGDQYFSASCRHLAESASLTLLCCFRSSVG